MSSESASFVESNKSSSTVRTGSIGEFGCAQTKLQTSNVLSFVEAKLMKAGESRRKQDRRGSTPQDSLVIPKPPYLVILPTQYLAAVS